MESETNPNKAHHENGQKEPLDPGKIAPTTLQSKHPSIIEDFRCTPQKKENQYSVVKEQGEG